MKTAQDPRHQHRIDLMQKLFAASFGNQPDSDILPIWEKRHLIDPEIQRAAPEWTLDKITKTDLAILRQAVYEIQSNQDVPEKVIIDEAVELAKSYSNPTSPAFINGVLGTIIKTNHHPDKEPLATETETIQE